MATIMSSPWARLMIFITPMMMVMPMPMRAYSPPSKKPDMSVWSRTSSWTEDIEHLSNSECGIKILKKYGVHETELNFGNGMRIRLEFNCETFTPHSALKLLPLPPRRHGIDIGCAGVLFRPDSFELTLDDLDRQRFVEVLVLVSFPVLELDR